MIHKSELRSIYDPADEFCFRFVAPLLVCTAAAMENNLNTFTRSDYTKTMLKLEARTLASPRNACTGCTLVQTYETERKSVHIKCLSH